MARSRSNRRNKRARDEDETLDLVQSENLSCVQKTTTRPRSKRTIEEDEPLQLVHIENISCNDIFFGRGNAVTHTNGNTTYREIVWKYRDLYASVQREGKKAIAKQVMSDIYALDPPGRFLEPVSGDSYRVVPTGRILEKCCQSLREKKYKRPDPDRPSLPLKKPSSRRNSSHRKVISVVKKKAKHEPPVKAIIGKKPTKAKSSRKKRKPAKLAAAPPDIVKTSELLLESDAHKPDIPMTEDEEVAIIYDKESFINAKKLLLGTKKHQPDTIPPPLEQPFGFLSIGRLDDALEECEGDVFEGMFNMVPASLVEFYSSHVHPGEGRNNNIREKTREETLESPTTVMDDFGFAQPVPLQMANSLYLEGESKWVNPADNVTANVVAAWTEFATCGAFA